MRHGSLFSGIGGWEYASEMMGWQNKFHCEINEFCRNILNHYWPDSECFIDIMKTDFTKYANRIDVLSGSCPCQPFSNAGKRGGTTDNRHLWPEMHRAIREIKPTWVCYENVPGLLTIENGVVFETVCADLENEGYETQTFIIPACAAGAVHRRDRVWIVAHNNGIGKEQRESEIGRLWNEFDATHSNVANDTGYNEWDARLFKKGLSKQAGRCNSNCAITDTINSGLQGNKTKEKRQKRNFRGIGNESWLEAATRLCCVDDEFTGRLDTTSISKSKWRTESLKAYGNAIYWPIALEIFKAIEETESLHPP